GGPGLWQVAERRGRLLAGHQGEMLAVAFARDGKLLASAGRDRSIRLWRTPDGASAGVLEGHTGEVTSIAFLADGRRLLSTGRDDTVRLWDIDQRTGRVLHAALGGAERIAVSPD